MNRVKTDTPTKRSDDLKAIPVLYGMRSRRSNIDDGGVFDRWIAETLTSKAIA